MSSTNLDSDEDFRREFWAWFDALNKEDKNRFWYYTADMAKIYFYNKHYVKIRANRLNQDDLHPAQDGMEVRR